MPTTTALAPLVALLARPLRDPKLRRRLLGAATAAYLLYYLNSVRRIKLHFGQGDRAASERIKRIIDCCPTLARVYWPTFFAPHAIGQILLLGLKEMRARLSPSPYERTLLRLTDGTHIALDWATPEEPLDDGSGPVCVLLHGAFQDASSVTMIDLAVGFVKRGMPTVVMNRRGYGGLPIAEGSKLSVFGFDEDLDLVLEQVGRRFPGRCVALIGFSCGAGFSCRYAHTRGALSAWAGGEAKPKPSVGATLPRLLCTVCYDPGYNVGWEGAVSRIAPPYSWALVAALKYVYVYRHRDALSKRSPSSLELCTQLLSPRLGLRQTYRGLRRLSGAGDSSAWLEMQQPRIEESVMPTLLLNSVDDPVTRWENVEEARAEIAGNPNCVLAELRRGAHGCKFGFLGRQTMAEPIIAEFVLGAWRELQRQATEQS